MVTYNPIADDCRTSYAPGWDSFYDKLKEEGLNYVVDQCIGMNDELIGNGGRVRI